MSTAPDVAAFIRDQVNDASARIRAMFGEYALYYNERVVALICDNQVFVKITPGTTSLLGTAYKTGLPYPGAKPAYVLSADIIEDGESLHTLLRACAADIKPSKSRAKKKK